MHLAVWPGRVSARVPPDIGCCSASSRACSNFRRPSSAADSHDHGDANHQSDAGCTNHDDRSGPDAFYCSDGQSGTGRADGDHDAESRHHHVTHATIESNRDGDKSSSNDDLALQ